MQDNSESLAAVRSVLEKFQDGYTARDPKQIDSFMQLFIPDDELEIIGTGANLIGEDEWCIGPMAALDLIESDWEGWGDVRIDIDNAHIHMLGDVAWVAVPGTVSMHLDGDETYSDYLEYIEQVTVDEGLSPEQRIFEIVRGASNTIYEVSRGDDYTWPFRFTAVLVHREDRWLFHQVQFSFPTTRYPDERIIKN